MNQFDRRQFLKILAAASAMAALPKAVSAATTAPRVVVVGGGFGGATVPKYLRMWGGNIDVTLVEPKPTHISCILSNLVLTAGLSMSRITLSYDSLRNTGSGDERGRWPGGLARRPPTGAWARLRRLGTANAAGDWARLRRLTREGHVEMMEQGSERLPAESSSRKSSCVVEVGDGPAGRRCCRRQAPGIGSNHVAGW